MGGFLSQWDFFFFASKKTYGFEFLQAKEAPKHGFNFAETEKSSKNMNSIFCKLAQKMTYFSLQYKKAKKC